MATTIGKTSGAGGVIRKSSQPVAKTMNEKVEVNGKETQEVEKEEVKEPTLSDLVKFQQKLERKIAANERPQR